MIHDPQFLSEKNIIEFKKGTCIFCDSKLNTKKVKDRIGEERRGSHYTEHHVKVGYKKYLISDLDIYLFEFDFDEESKAALGLKEKELVEKIKREKEEESPKLRKNLEFKFSELDLSGKQKKIAIDSLIDNYLSELNKEYYLSQTPLEKRIEKLYHNLQLGDLKFICDERWGGDIVEKGNKDIECIRTYFNPIGLKSHKKCWPFSDFDKPMQFSLKFREFFKHIKENPRFRNYESLFEDFPGLLEEVLDLNIIVGAKNYNPVDYT